MYAPLFSFALVRSPAVPRLGRPPALQDRGKRMVEQCCDIVGQHVETLGQLRVEMSGLESINWPARRAYSPRHEIVSCIVLLVLDESDRLPQERK